jgi:pyruvate-formate lyase-activating enzyme
MTLRTIEEILNQARDVGSVEWIYFEGGEPFLYYAVLLEGVRMSRGLGFRVGIVSNGYWATESEDALEWLRPLAWPRQTSASRRLRSVSHSREP